MSGVKRMQPREQIVALVMVGTKQRLWRCSQVSGISITQLLEMSAPGFEQATLERLKTFNPEQFPKNEKLYMQGRLTALEVYGRNRLAARKILADAPRVVLSCKVTRQTKQMLDRYCSFYAIPLAHLIYRMANNWDKHVRASLSPEHQQLFDNGKLTREMLFPPPPAPDEDDEENGSED
jgi:hypothetical protein